MKTILRIDSSARHEGSHSRTLGDYFEKQWLSKNPDAKLLSRDLASRPIEHIQQDTITGFYTPPEQLTDGLIRATALSDELINELQAANTLLITVPLYNFSIPSSLKAWIDQVSRIGHTFSYDGERFQGLVKTKRAYIICAYGSSGYLPGNTLASANFLQPYLQFVLNFLGIQAVHFFSLEGASSDEATIATNVAHVKSTIDQSVSA